MARAAARATIPFSAGSIADLEPDGEPYNQPAMPGDARPERPADVTAAAATSPPRGVFSRLGLGHVGVWAPCAVTGGWADTATNQRAANMKATAEREAQLRAEIEDRRKRKQEFDDKTKQ